MHTSKLIAISAVLLVACGRDTPSSSKTGHAASVASTSSRKPCEYVARADAEAAIGEPLPQTMESVEMHECDYTTAQATGMSLSIASWETIRANIATYQRNTPSVAVTGVGDEAVSVPRALFVRKGDRGFKVELSGAQIDGLHDFGLERAKTLALKIFPGF